MKLLVNVKPPKEKCEKWFEKNFEIGDKIELIYNADLEGLKRISGCIENFNFPLLTVNKENFSIYKIFQITKCNFEELHKTNI